MLMFCSALLRAVLLPQKAFKKRDAEEEHFLITPNLKQLMNAPGPGMEWTKRSLKRNLQGENGWSEWKTPPQPSHVQSLVNLLALNML